MVAGGQASEDFSGSEQSEKRTDVLKWNRAQQAAYLITLWSRLEHEIETSNEEWGVHLRKWTRLDDPAQAHDPAFAGRYSMLATDQGVRGFLQVCNDISFQSRHDVPFVAWQRSTSSEATNEFEVTEALEELSEHAPISGFIGNLTADIARFDWRSAVTPHLPRPVENFQSRYRGGSGYKQVRLQLLRHLAENGSESIADLASSVAHALNYYKEFAD